MAFFFEGEERGIPTTLRPRKKRDSIKESPSSGGEGGIPTTLRLEMKKRS
jgi:hypothetical protein